VSWEGEVGQIEFRIEADIGAAVFHACCGFSFATESEKENGREKLPAVSGGSA
jgi:hypothetical protein